ncbi:MAG: pilus assembly protein TadG-related protein [Pseudolabrys sp.]
MTLQSVASYVRRIFSKFAAARSGNVAVHFAIAIIPIVGGVGAAVDYSRANSVKAAMQAALDSTALMLYRDAASLTPLQLQTKAQNYFLAMFDRPDTNNVALTATYASAGGSSVVVNATADVPTAMMGIAGINHLTIKGTATSAWGSQRLRVALVLDNTGSMSSNGKMDALKSATKGLLTQLKNAANVNGDVYVSIIPFSKDVNVGSGNVNATWIDWTSWEAVNGTCSADTWYVKYKSSGSCQNAGGTWTVNSHSNWNGCVTDRGPSGSSPGTSTWDQRVDAPNGTANSMWPAEQFNSCPVAMMGLSYDWTSMNSLVDQMQPAGNTNQPIGLVWGWQSLVGGGPLSAPAKDNNYTYKEIIILLSDGLNTQNRWSSSQSSVDARMYNSSGAGTCANIKAAGAIVYAVQVNTDGDPLSTIMQNCASDTSKFFMLTSANQIVTTFGQIGTNLTQLRVAK